MGRTRQDSVKNSVTLDPSAAATASRRAKFLGMHRGVYFTCTRQLCIASQ